jgi:hypothetical protein
MTAIPGGRYGAAPDLTRRFRIAKTPSVPWDEVKCRHFALISLTRGDSRPAAILQRALRYSFSVVPSNSR